MIDATVDRDGLDLLRGDLVTVPCSKPGESEIVRTVAGILGSSEFPRVLLSDGLTVTPGRCVRCPD